MRLDRTKQTGTKQQVHRSTSTPGNGSTEVWHPFPYHLQQNNNRNICNKRSTKIGRRSTKEGKKEKNKKPTKAKVKNETNYQTYAQGAGRVPRGQASPLCRYDQSYIQLIDQQRDGKQKKKRRDGRNGSPDWFGLGRNTTGSLEGASTVQ